MSVTAAPSVPTPRAGPSSLGRSLGAPNRQESVQLGLQPTSGCRIHLAARTETEARQLIGLIFAVMDKAVRYNLPTQEGWMTQDLHRVMVLIGGLDEEMAQTILDQEET